jgi:hypothetical protein
VNGVSYAMGFEVSQHHGVTKISHDGSDFGSHANGIIVPDRQWGIVVMENAENSPYDFFGSHR